MTYNPNIPQGTDNLSASQVQILDNFGQLNAQFGIDHTAFNTGSGNGDGFHKKATFVSQGSDPATGVNQVALYNKANELFVRLQNNATPFKLVGAFSAAQNGYINLYGSILLQWGRASIPGGNNTVAVTFPIAFSSTAYIVDATLYGSPSTDASRGFGVTESSITNLGFTALNFNSGFTLATTFGWLAIGPA